MATTHQDKNQSLSARTGSLIGLVTAVIVVLILTNILSMRVANSESESQRTPLLVSTTSYQLQDSYERQVRYLGLTVAGARATLSFEVGGLVASAPLREGTPVQAGEVIAELDTEALLLRRRSVAAELKQVQLDLELAQLREKRQRDLRSSNAISVDRYDEARLTASSLEARGQAVQARLSSIDLDLSKSRLVAPYDGLVADRFVHQGTVVAAGSPVVRLIAGQNKEAHIGVSAGRAQNLVIGDNYPLDMQGKTIEAKLLSIRPDVDPVTRATTAVFALPDETIALDGEPVSLVLSETIEMRGGWLPVEALQEGRRGTWTVMRVEQSSNGSTQAQREVVEVLEVQGQQAYVRGTLQSQALVIAEGLHRIIPGSQIQIAGAP